MKQIKFAGAVMAAVLMLLTSCLGDTGNSGQLPLPGRVRYANGKMLIDTHWNVLYTSQLQTLEYFDGDWVYVNFSYDFGTPENANYEANGYVNVTLLESPVAIPAGIVMPFSDTTKVMANEIALLQGFHYSTYAPIATLGGDIMFASTYSNSTDQETSFWLYYDYSKEPVASDSGNIYTLYVRATKTAEGKDPKQNLAALNYYDIESILNTIYAREKGAGKTNFFFDIRHIDEIDEETGELTWKSNTTLFTMYVPTE